jgi:protein ImuB
MDRLACIDVPALPLQLLVRDHPDWRDLPVAVVAEEAPQAPLLWVNERARQAGLLPGQRYAAALSLALGLRAGTVPRPAIAQGVAMLADLLRRHTPDVEPSRDEPGVFWLSAHGFERLYGSLPRWAAAVQDEVARAGLTAHVAVGFTRFGTYAVAKSGCGRRILARVEEESRLARAVPLGRLGADPALRDALDPLGVKTVGDLLRLPAGGMLRRFGPSAYRLHRLASGDLWTPLQPDAPDPPRERRTDVEPPDIDAARLLFLAKRLLDSLLVELRTRGEAVQALVLHLIGERGKIRLARVLPAAPGLDAVQLLMLTRLKLESLQLEAPVAELALTAEIVPATAEQLRLARARRSPEAASRALARLRAALGEDAVVCARLADAHVPDRRFRWEGVEHCGLRIADCGLKNEEPQGRRGEEAQRRPEGENLEPRTSSLEPIPTICNLPPGYAGYPAICNRPLVRRIYREPIPLPPRPRHEPDGWLLSGLEAGPVAYLRGPYVLSTNWWEEEERREYYFVAMQRGDVLWVFRDPRSRRWFLQGRVE